MADRSTMNPWSTKDGSLGVRLGDPQSGLTLARRHGLLDVTSKHQVRVYQASLICFTILW